MKSAAEEEEEEEEKVYSAAGWGVWMEGIDIRTRVDISRQGHTTTLLHYWCLMDGFYGMGVSRCLRVTKPRVPQPLCHNNFLAAHHPLSFPTLWAAPVKIPTSDGISRVPLKLPDLNRFSRDSFTVRFDIGLKIIVRPRIWSLLEAKVESKPTNVSK